MPVESPSLRHRRLTIELRRLRKSAGLTREEAASRMEWYGSKITRWETGGWKRIQPHDLRGLLAVYGITDKDAQDRYVQLARRAQERGWWNDYPDVTVDYTAFEDEASTIQTFEPCYVPGLLQTEDYARALIRANPVVEHDEADRRVAVRLERQKLLGPDGPHFRAIIDEAVIRRPVGDHKIMADQLRHLIGAMNATQRVNLQVLPFAAGAHPGMAGSFVVLRYTDPVAPSVVYLETAIDGQYPDGEAVIDRYSLMFEHLLAMALSPRDSIALMEDVIASLWV